MGAAMALVFGFGAALTHRRMIHAMVGVGVGIAIAFLICMFATPHVIQLSADAVRDVQNPDRLTIILHSVQWAVIAVPTAVVIGIAVASPFSGLKAVGATLLTAFLAGLVYMMGSAIIEPGARIAQFLPQPGKTFYLWACMPPALLGLFLSRTKL